MRPYLETNPSQKRAGGVAQGVDLEFKPQYQKKKKKKSFVAKPEIQFIGLPGICPSTSFPT
jgi:hypothetical protein